MEQIFLNLENKSYSEVNFKYNCFPDGQTSITIDEDFVKDLYKSVEVVIIKSISNFSVIIIRISNIFTQS